MIIINNEEALRVNCENVLPEEVGSLVELLESELKQSARLGRPGAGLAAPQIGIAKKIAIVRLGTNGHYNLNFNLINCEIKKSFDLKMFANEGCLSFPGRVENTMRFQEVLISNNIDFVDSFVATGLAAVVCQHEIDHLNSILLPDKAIVKSTIKNKIKVNDLCFCGSKRKYKKCCMENLKK